MKYLIQYNTDKFTYIGGFRCEKVHKKSRSDWERLKKLNPEVCPKTGTLRGFRYKVRNRFVIL